MHSSARSPSEAHVQHDCSGDVWSPLHSECKFPFGIDPVVMFRVVMIHACFSTSGTSKVVTCCASLRFWGRLGEIPKVLDTAMCSWAVDAMLLSWNK